MKSLHHPLMALVFSCLMVVAASGCVPLWVGAGVVGIVGGYAVSPDTVEGTSNRGHEECYDAAKQIAGIMGQIVQETPGAGEIIAMVNGSRVTITVAAATTNSTKISVKARKVFMPKVDLAQDIYAKIINTMDK